MKSARATRLATTPIERELALHRYEHHLHGSLRWGLDVILRRTLRGRPSWRSMRFAPPAIAVSKKPKRLAWSVARKATLARDSHRCRKCGARDDLEVHHIKERVDGGLDELDNLIALCSACHCEWTFCQPPTMTFDAWLGQLPARWLVPLLAKEWPSDVSAADFKEHLLNAVALAMVERDRDKSR